MRSAAARARRGGSGSRARRRQALCRMEMEVMICSGLDSVLLYYYERAGDSGIGKDGAGDAAAFVFRVVGIG